MNRRTLITAIALLIGTAYVQSDPFIGSFSDGQLTLTLGSGGLGYLGDIRFDGQRFPVRAARSSTGLVGEFDTSVGTFHFEASNNGAVLVLVTDGASYRLSPMGAAPQTAGANASFHSLPTPGGRGTLLIGTVAAGSAIDGLIAATDALLGHFDPFPRFLGGIGDRQGASLQTPFVATVAGVEVFGVAAAHRSDSIVTVGFAFDSSVSAPQTLDALMGELGRHVPIQQPAPAAAAPALSWQTVPFPDNSGRIDLPSSWTLTAATQGMVDLAGPGGTELHLGLWTPVSTPEVAVDPFTGRPYPGILSAPLLSPPDAVAALFPQMYASFGVDYRIRNFVDVAPNPSQGGEQSAFLMWDAEVNGRTLRHFGLIVTAAVSFDQWLLYYSYGAAPIESFDREFPTLMEIWGRWELNPALFQQRLQSAAQSMQEAGDLINSSFNATQASQDASAYAWSEAFRGVATVRDTATGDEGTADLGWIDQTIGAMNQRAGYDRFEYVPLDTWWLGTAP